jgi:two-component system response regulator FixJ
LWQDVIASNGKQQTVFVVDDDAGIRDAMQALLDVDGKQCVAVGTADELLATLDPAACGCIVLDIRLPGMGGLELQDELRRRGSALPIIFITGHADVALAVTAMRNGAFDFLEKPFDDDRLLACVDSALEVSAARMAHHEIEQATEEHYRQLTDREREVLDLVVTGKPNKVIAYALGVSQRTVEIHRSRVMKKMRARSLADLVKMHLRLTGDTP